MFKNNLKIALRNLKRHYTFTAINIAGLSLGMAAAIFAFLWVQNEFSFNTYHEQANNIYRINTDLQVSADNVWHWGATPLLLADAAKNEMPEVISAASLYQNPWQSFTLKNKAKTLSTKKHAYVSESWFDMFDHQFIDGSSEGFQEQLHSIIFTRHFAEKLFGRTEVVGESFQVDSMEFVVQAVIENHPSNSGFTFELLLPISYYLSIPSNKENETWSSYNTTNFLLLPQGIDAKSIGEKLTGIVQKYDEQRNFTLTAQPLADVYFDEERSQVKMLIGNKKAAYTFGIIGFIILFLACVNYVSLTTAQAGNRTKEVGVRKIIGAGGAQVFQLLFTESLVITVVSLVTALGIVKLTMPLFNQFTEKVFQLNPTSTGIWMICGGTLLATLLMSGIYPAFFLTGFSPNQFLKGQHFFKMKNTGFRKSLVVVQFVVTVVLLIGAIVMLQQQEYIRQKDLGFDRSHVFEFQLPWSDRREANVVAIKQALGNSPSVLATSASNSTIINMKSTHSGSLDWDGKPEDFVPTVSQMSVDTDLADLIQLPLVEGRWFEPNSLTDLNNVLLNETAVQLFNLPEPVVGQKFHFHGNEGKVVGIVKDFNYLSLRQKIEPLVLYINPPANGNIMVKTSEGNVATAIAAAEKAWATHYPSQPFEYQFLDERFDKLYKSEQKNAALFQVLAGLAIFISCLGLFGLAVFSTQQRTKEIGIRKVLGASTTGLVILLSEEFIKLICIALIIATPIAWYFMNGWLDSFAYRINIQWWIFLVTGIVAIGIGLLTVGFNSLKAALSNPVKAIKEE